MNSILKRKNLCLLLSFLLIALSFAKTNAQSRYSKEIQAEFSVRKDKIQTELSRLQTNEWAGEYNVHGLFLFLAPKAGFAFYMSGGDYDANWENFLLNYGTIQFSETKIKLTPELPNKEEVLPSYSTELLPILWDERHYLIPADEVVEFINYVNIGYEPSFAFAGLSNHFFLKKGDIEKKVVGKPNIPEQYRGYLLEKPIKGKITTIKNSKLEQDGDRQQRNTEIILNVGKNNGVFEGMKFLIYSPRRISADDVKITKVEDNHSEAIVIQTYLKEKTPSVGWKVSTSLKDIK